LKGWHFLTDDRRLQFGDREEVKVGEWLRVEGELKMCSWGLHASKRAIDALRYAPGSVACRVELRSDLQHDDDKSVGRERRVMWMLDATNIQHECACRYAEGALALIDKPDPRSVAAIQAKRKWLRGEITDAELAAARAASAAAWAASDAAFYAARSASAAARAASDAAWYAARAAARSASARAAASAKQNRILTSMLVAEAKRQGVFC
jgi:hypothetical protein